MNTEIRNRARSEGFSLIEVLVAVVVLAVGVLGVAALQTQSLAQGQGSLQATQALALAYDYADRIHANICGAYAGLYEVQWTSPPSSSTPSPDCSSASCNYAQLATYDRWQWYNKLVKTTFPSGAYVDVSCSDGAACATSSYPYSACGGVVNYTPQTISIYVFWNQKAGNAPNSTGGSSLTPTLTATTQPWTSAMQPECVTPSFDPSKTLPCVVVSVQP